MLIDFGMIKLLAQAGFAKVRRKALDKIELIELFIQKLRKDD